MQHRPEEDYDKQAAEQQSEDNYVQLSIKGDSDMNEVKAGPDKLMVESPQFFKMLAELTNEREGTLGENTLEKYSSEAVTGVIISVGPQSEDKGVVLFTEGMTVWFEAEKWIDHVKIQGKQVVLLNAYDVLAYC